MSYYPIILRHDITSQWEASNYVLRKGEAGLDITLKKFKIGDGTTGWNSLDYFNIASLSVDQSLKLDSAYDHISSDGKAHSDVVLNNEHRASDGKDHSDVVLNNTHRSTNSGNPHNVLVTDLAQDSTHRFVTDTEKSTWNSKSDFSGSYDDLSDKPTIPSAITELNDIPDVNILTPADGDMLRYNGTSEKYEAVKRVGFSARDGRATIPASTWTDVSFQIEDEDTDDSFNGTTWTVPAGKGGLYFAAGHLTLSAINSGKVAIVGLSVNGINPGSTANDGGLFGRGVGVNGGLGGYGGGIRIFLNAGDVVKMQVYCANATSLYITKGYNTFSIYKMIP